MVRPRHGAQAAAVALLVAVHLLMSVPAFATVPARGAGEAPATTGTTFEDAVPGRIIPEPDTGRPPEEPGDRGGWQQFLVLGLVVGGLAVIVGIVARQAGLHHRRTRGEG